MNSSLAAGEIREEPGDPEVSSPRGKEATGVSAFLAVPLVVS